MSMNDTLKEFVQKSWVKKIDREESLPDVVIPSENDLKLLNDAGFHNAVGGIYDQIRDSKRRDLEYETAGQLLQKNTILLKIPEFKYEAPYSQNVITIARIVGSNLLIVGAIIVAGALLSSMILTLFGAIYTIVSGFVLMFTGLIATESYSRPNYTVVKLGMDKYLYTSDIHSFRGHVPVEVAKTVLEYKKNGEFGSPEIWGIATRDELATLTEGKVRVRDPLLVYHYNGLSDYVVLAAIWGKDIQALDKALS